MKNSIEVLVGVALTAAVLTLPQKAQAANFSLTATLDQAQEIPTPLPVPGASGSAAMTFDTDENLLSWNIAFSGLSDTPILAHFHGAAPAGATAPVQVDIAAISGLNSPLIGSATLTEQQESDLLAGLWYINIHTNLNPTGEIRGQVQVVATPEPSSLGFLAITGISLIGYRLQRKKKDNSSAI
jgi:hypothetical protein